VPPPQPVQRQVDRDLDYDVGADAGVVEARGAPAVRGRVSGQEYAAACRSGASFALVAGRSGVVRPAIRGWRRSYRPRISSCGAATVPVMPPTIASEVTLVCRFTTPGDQIGRAGRGACDDPLKAGVDGVEQPGAGDGRVGGGGCEHQSVRQPGGQELLELAAPLPVRPVTQVDAVLAEQGAGAAGEGKGTVS
jgi:hypothetical protein